MSTTSSSSRSLGLVPATALVAGSMLGIGIFIAPAVVAAHATRPSVFILLWIAGGLSALFGALAVAELGAMMPRAGGDYPYLRRAYGPHIAFAAGWLQLLAIFPGSLATMAVATSTFQLPVLLGEFYTMPQKLGLPVGPAFFWALVIVFALTALNHLGVVISGRVQVGLTIIPISILLVAGLFVLLRQGTAGGAWAQSNLSLEAPGIDGLAFAFLPVYFAYSGWNAAIFVGGEIRNPGRNLPRALVWGTIAVTVLYLVLCVGFLAVFTMDTLQGTGEAGTAVARTMFGARGEFLITMLILLAMLGSINGNVLAGSRIAYAMAEHGHCPPVAARLDQRFSTPAVALWLQAGWTVVLLATHRFEELMNYASAAMLITGTLTVLAVIVLRRKLPRARRPYRAWGYPFTPIAYAVSSMVVLAVLAWKSDPSVFLGAGWFIAALAFHRFWLADKEPRLAADSSLAEPPVTG